MSTLTDKLYEKRLLHRVVNRKDADAYAEIYDAYVERIYRFVVFKISDQEQAQDVTSDVFLKVWDYLTRPESKDVQSLSGLLYRTARNIVIDVYRQRAKLQQQSLLDIDEAAVATDTTTVIETKDEVSRLLNQIQSLKREYQEIILLRFIEELTISEIAVILGKKQTNVRVLIHRALKKLKQLNE